MFPALPENILLAMITDRRLNVRQEAVNKILRAIEHEVDNLNHCIRCKMVPHLNFEAMDYGEMIHWESTDVSINVLPVVRNISNEEIVE